MTVLSDCLAAKDLSYNRVTVIETLVLSLCLASAVQSSSPSCAVDLFLVAGNERPVKGVEWIQSPQTGVERLLQPVVKAFASKKHPFVIIDGGDCAVFPTGPIGQDIQVTERTYSTYDSKTESTQTKHGSRSHVVERTESEQTMTLGATMRPFKNAGYISQSTLGIFPVDSARFGVVIQDLNSYVASFDRGTSQEKLPIGNTLLLSRDSIEFTSEFLRTHPYQFKGICICANGIPTASTPGFVAFPPSGVIGHYTLSRIDGEWKIRLDEYIR